MRGRIIISALIPNGTSLSQDINVDRGRIVGIQMPSAWTAAGIAFQALLREPSALPKAPVYGSVQDQAAAAVNITGAVADAYIAIPATFPLKGLGRILVRSGTNAVPVAQGADRTLGIVVDFDD